MSALNEKRTEEEKAKNIAWLRNLPNAGAQAKRERVLEPSQLPTWVRDAILAHDVDGLPWKAICKKKGKNAKTLAVWISTPGAKKLRESIANVVADPVGTVRLRAKTDANWAYTEAVQLYRICKEAGDRANAIRLLHHFADLAEAKAPPKQQTNQIIQINVQGTSVSLEAPSGDASFETVQAEVVDE